MDSYEDDPRGLVGLQNLGNTCYMNAALQALSNCQQLTRFVLDCPSSMKEVGLSRSYSELIKEIWSSKNPKYAVPSSIMRNIKCIYPAFRGCTQQDAQEFLRCFLEQLHDELKKPAVDPEIKCRKLSKSSNSSSSSLVSTTSDSYDIDANYPPGVNISRINGTETTSTESPQTRGDNLDESQRSIISDTFEFKISSSVVCSNCNNISTTKETFKDLSIPIPSKDHPYYQISSNEHLNKRVDSQVCAKRSSEGRNTKVKHIQKLPTGDDINQESASSSDPILVKGQETSDETTDDDDEESMRLTGLQSYQLLNYIPFAGWFLNWFSQLGYWFWGPQVTLDDCLSIFFGTDPLEGDNEYSCEVCTKKNRGVKYLKILELPEVLCIHFKRYESVGSSKITTHVSFPLTGLDLSPFMSESCRPQCTTYNLIACICHHGSALLTGHYTTYALNCYDDQWYEFDDQYVSSVSSYQVENSEAYILFYQKSELDDSTDRQREKAGKSSYK